MSDTQSTGDHLIALETEALARWGKGDPRGFLDLYAPNISYFDPMTSARVDGHGAMTDYYGPWVEKIHISRSQMLNPHVVVHGNMALLTYNLVNYMPNADGTESVGSCWNSTTVFQQQDGAWKSIHSHWSFTRHAALQTDTPEDSEHHSA